MNKQYVASFMGWHMIILAANHREAQRVANKSVTSFGGIVGVDRPSVRIATEEDISSYRAMAGWVR